MCAPFSGKMLQPRATGPRGGEDAKGSISPQQESLSWLWNGLKALHQETQIRSPVRLCSFVQPSPPQSSSNTQAKEREMAPFQGLNSQDTCCLLFAYRPVKEAVS